MFGLAALLSLITQVSGTPYIPGGDSPAGTDCSGLASWVANVASGRPAFGSRFNTGNIESALLARGFHYGSAPGSVVIGWNSGHAAVTLPDGTPVSSGESGAGVRVGGGGAYQPQFSRHMYLPVQAEQMNIDPPAEPVLAEPPVDLPVEPVLAEPPVDLPADPVLAEPVLAEPPVEPLVEPPVDLPAEPVLAEPPVEPVLAEPPVEPPVDLPAEPAAAGVTG
jgi:hypothetical protein